MKAGKCTLNNFGYCRPRGPCLNGTQTDTKNGNGPVGMQIADSQRFTSRGLTIAPCEEDFHVKSLTNTGDPRM